MKALSHFLNFKKLYWKQKSADNFFLFNMGILGMPHLGRLLIHPAQYSVSRRNAGNLLPSRSASIGNCCVGDIWGTITLILFVRLLSNNLIHMLTCCVHVSFCPQILPPSAVKKYILFSVHLIPCFFYQGHTISCMQAPAVPKMPLAIMIL